MNKNRSRRKKQKARQAQRNKQRRDLDQIIYAKTFGGRKARVGLPATEFTPEMIIRDNHKDR